ncbi:MAG TPA: lipoate--protein ligase family protein [Anaerolineales bacterium]|nr:lipoate--protein ligase family protein [Anaerolineales bacterium]
MSLRSRARWRLIRSGASGGAWNMALDEALLESVAVHGAPPTLRLYAWEPPCLSIGYAQAAQVVDETRLAALGWALVRRPTGGRAILHTDELTYAVIAPLTHADLSHGVLPSYRTLSAGLVRALSLLGISPEIQPEPHTRLGLDGQPICFEVPSAYEITAEGKKLIGSAQLRRRGALLQHGSLPLQGDLGRIALCLRFPDEQDREEAMRRVRSRADTVAGRLGRTVSWEEAAEAMAEGFGQSLEIDFVPGEPTEEELRMAREKRSQHSAAWDESNRSKVAEGWIKGRA